MKKYMIPCSGKMVLLDKLLPKLKREGHKVLIFSQMVKMIDLIEEFCEFRHYSVERLDGRVRGNERQKVCFISLFVTWLMISNRDLRL